VPKDNWLDFGGDPDQKLDPGFFIADCVKSVLFAR